MMLKKNRDFIVHFNRLIVIDLTQWIFLDYKDSAANPTSFMAAHEHFAKWALLEKIADFENVTEILIFLAGTSILQKPYLVIPRLFGPTFVWLD